MYNKKYLDKSIFKFVSQFENNSMFNYDNIGECIEKIKKNILNIDNITNNVSSHVIDEYRSLLLDNFELSNILENVILGSYARTDNSIYSDMDTRLVLSDINNLQKIAKVAETEFSLREQIGINQSLPRYILNRNATFGKKHLQGV